LFSQDQFNFVEYPFHELEELAGRLEALEEVLGRRSKGA
jgi:hypothetical protein